MYSRVRKPGALGVRAVPGAPAEETALISKGADDETIPGPWLASCVGLGCLRTRAGALPRLCPTGCIKWGGRDSPFSLFWAD